MKWPPCYTAGTLGSAVFVLLLACAGDASPPTPGAPPKGALAALLATPAQLGTIEVPASTRPAAELEATDVALAGPWELVRTVGGVDELAMPLPVRPLDFVVRQAPLDLAVTDGAGAAAPFDSVESKAPAAGSWGLDGPRVLVRVPTGTQPTGLKLTCARAYERERALHLSTSKLEPAQFAMRTLRVGNQSRTGLLLPPPGKATWQVDVPPAGVLTFDGTILPPEVGGAASDGASVVVSVQAEGGGGEVGRTALSVAAWQAARFDLSAYAGKKVTITFQSEAGATDTLDHVFLAAPTVYTPSETPRRVVLVFIDTLRRDHLGTYGYSRPTTPNIDAFAKEAVVFDQARTVAPWTLPSSRAMLSGQHPEEWGTVATFPELFGQGGFLPVAVTTNHLLTESFGMADGWAFHQYLGDVAGGESVDLAISELEHYADRDVAMLVHLMDPHLPYREPADLRHTWAGDDPKGLGGLFNKKEVDALRVQKLPPDQAAPIKQYLIDRYDQEILYADRELGRLLQKLGPNDIVAIVSDHGEEFFEHDGFEHGHTLYDELLRVPMIIRAPGLPAGRSDAPVSLLDTTPTLLALAGAPASGTDGRSLIGVATATEGARADIDARVQVFGRKYYGRDRWGVLREGRKWVTSDGMQNLYDLKADPQELTDLGPAAAATDLDGYRVAMAQALGRDVPVVWRLFTSPFRTPIDQEVRFRVEHPGGIQKAWRGYDWKGTKSEFTVQITVKDGVAEVVQRAGELAPAEVFILPNGDATDPRGLKVTSDVGGTPIVAEWGPARKPPPVKADVNTVYAKPFNGDVKWALGLAITPVMEEATTSDFNPESLEQLRILGYVQ
jgi:arylsulfatase A-like enzyme